LWAYTTSVRIFCYCHRQVTERKRHLSASNPGADPGFQKRGGAPGTNTGLT